MEPIDFCVALSGPNVGVLWKIFWTTLTRNCNIYNVRFHLINKDVPGNIIDDITTSMGIVEVSVYNLPLLVSNCPEFNGIDVDYTCDFIMNKCGVYKWACISHFDLWFKKDWLTYARGLIANDVAIVGNHCPIMLLNREAYKQSLVKFACVNGLDTAQGLQEEMRGLGWKVESRPELNKDSETEEAHNWFHHIGGGGTHYKEPEVSEKFLACKQIIEELGI